MKREILIVAFALVFCGGLVIGYFVVPSLIPKKTIMEKLHEENIHFYAGKWYAGKLEYAESIESFRDFQRFAWAYEEKCDPQYNPYGDPWVYIDKEWKVVWMEVKDTEGLLVYVGFYFY